MPDVEANAELVACCGLYCGACRAYRGGKCSGCLENSRASWCKVRSCCSEKGIRTCAECADFQDPLACKKFNNFMSKLFGFVFKSDRAACIAQIRHSGLDGHARAMAEIGAHTIKR